MQYRRVHVNRPFVWSLWTWLLVLGTAGAVSAADYRPLIGDWQRTDGGYVIQVRRVDADGTMEARYLNPRAINVSQAKASALQGYIKVVLELRDVGYPGSTYTLLYDPEKDALLGNYFQAVQRQTYDVVFVRMNRHSPE